MTESQANASDNDAVMYSQITADSAAAQEANALEAKLNKLRKKMREGLPEEIEAEDEEQLRQRIVDCQAQMHEAEQAKEADTELEALRERVKEMAAPYAETKKSAATIAQYATIQLMKMGKA